MQLTVHFWCLLSPQSDKYIWHENETCLIPVLWLLQLRSSHNNSLKREIPLTDQARGPYCKLWMDFLFHSNWKSNCVAEKTLPIVSERFQKFYFNMKRLTLIVWNNWNSCYWILFSQDKIRNCYLFVSVGRLGGMLTKCPLKKKDAVFQHLGENVQFDIVYF